MKKIRLFLASSISIFLLASCNKATNPYTCTVYFDSDGGTFVPTQKVKLNKTVTEPSKPSKQSTDVKSYTFDAWYKVVAGKMEEKPFNFANTLITENITLKAKWISTARLYTITFDTGEGDPVAPITDAKYGIAPGKDKKPTDPKRESSKSTDYTFGGWEDPFGNIFDFEKSEVFGDITLTAIWNESVRKYTITFDSAGGDPVAPVTGVEYGTIPGKVKEPKEPNRESDQAAFYIFDGWKDPEGEIFDFARSRIFGDITLTAIWKPIYKKYTIFFETDGGTLVAPIANVVYGTAPGEDRKPDDPSKKPSESTNYIFGGWRDSEGNMFDFATSKIYGDTYLTAVWIGSIRKFTVYFDSNGGTQVKSIQVDYEKPVTIAKKPKDPTKEDAYISYNFICWELDGAEYHFTEPVTRDIVLKAKWEVNESSRKKTSFHVYENDDLIVKTMNDEEIAAYHYVTIKAGLDFSFKVAAKNDLMANADVKIVPSVLNIFIGQESTPLAPGYGYSIEWTSEVHVEAIVTINGSAIVGDKDICIEENSAIERNVFQISLDCYGVNSDLESEYCYADQDKIIKFEKIGSYTLPLHENICINVDGQEWLYLTDSKASQYCDYDSDTGVLTIKANTVSSYINIVSRSKTYQLLENCSWERIDELSKNGWARMAFYPGETKTVLVNNLKHQVRIIGFNHDDCTDLQVKAGITFEFANLITDSNGAVNTICSHGENDNFPESVLNNFLNKDPGCVFSKLPSDLQKYVKTVDKSVAMGPSRDSEIYQTKLFPLAHNEITDEISEYAYGGEGETYQYYLENKGEEYRIKPAAEGKESRTTYWLRSPSVKHPASVWEVSSKNGTLYDNLGYGFMDGHTAPAFCI